MPRKSNIAILHIDASIIPDNYLEYASTFPICINKNVADITKKMVSGATIAGNANWPGPFIVKSNLNYYGIPESRMNDYAKLANKPAPFPAARINMEYTIYNTYSEIPTSVFRDQDLTVEKFIPEVEDNCYAIRHWVFCGEKEHCNRYLSESKVIKGENVIKKTTSEIPDALRRRREELGFDYGKFDFVIHDGQPILFDSNKTPGLPPNNGDETKRAINNLADGLDSLLIEAIN